VAEHASNILQADDVNTVTGALEVEITRAQHSRLTLAQWNAVRQATDQGGWPGLRNAFETARPGAGAWLDTFTAIERTALIYHFVSRGPRPPVPPLP
jgi:hypothetical protein